MFGGITMFILADVKGKKEKGIIDRHDNTFVPKDNNCSNKIQCA